MTFDLMVGWADATNDSVYAAFFVRTRATIELGDGDDSPRPERNPDMADIPTDWRRPLVMRSSRFVSQVMEGYRSGERYCFILGASASITSGATLRAMGRHEEVLAESDEALRLEPGSAEFHASAD